MCTASWLSGGRSGSGLVFNRDEQRSRPKAKPPAISLVDGVKVLAPIDEKGGGTWIAVSEYGLVAALLNNYEAQAKQHVIKDSIRTRGGIPLAFTRFASVAEAADAWDAFVPSDYNPFLLILWDGSATTRVFSWNGIEQATLAWDQPLITTSSFKTEEVESYRRSRFADYLKKEDFASLEARMDYHFDEAHPVPAFNPLMTREDGLTHSVTRVERQGGTVSVKYWERDFDSGRLCDPKESQIKLRDL